MSVLDATFSDARGQVRPVMSMAMMRQLNRDPRLKERMALAVRPPRPRFTAREAWLWFMYGVPALILPMLVAVSGPMLIFSSWPHKWWLIVPIGLASAVMPALVTGWVARRASGERIKVYCLRAELCPSCGYDLSAIETQPIADGADQCKVCPECGGAWPLKTAR